MVESVEPSHLKICSSNWIISPRIRVKIKHMNETTTQKYTRVKVVGTVTMQFISALYFPTFGGLCHVDHRVIKTYRKQTFHSDTKTKSRKCHKTPEQFFIETVWSLSFWHIPSTQKKQKLTPRWWFQPIWNILVKMEIFPKFRGENSKYWSCHHLDPVFNWPGKVPGRQPKNPPPVTVTRRPRR